MCLCARTSLYFLFILSGLEVEKLSKEQRNKMISTSGMQECVLRI